MESGKKDNEKVTMDSVKKLIAERDEIDRRIAKEEEILKMNNIDMQRSLVDAEGFPITSVDVYSVRRARYAIICAQNDRQKLTSEIEKAMLILHQQKRDCITAHSEHEKVDGISTVHRTSNAPFATIAKVMESSPAFRAKPIRVTVLRNNRPIRLELIPQAWSGKGTLGCSVLPVTPAHI
ncbi:putative 26S proteasome non-ATPase regulatory subunit [Dirofilaria immitis]